VPRLVQKAKDIKELIDANEVIGLVKQNDGNTDDDDDDDSVISVDKKDLAGTNLADKNGNIRRPETKKRKTENLQDAITVLGEQQIESANILAAAIANMAEKLGGSTTPSATSHGDPRLGNDLAAKVNGIEAKVDGIEEKLNAILAYFAR
jgi:hypothetical protein